MQYIRMKELRVRLNDLAAEGRYAPDKRLHKHIAQALKCATDDVIKYHIIRRSIDARKKPRLELIYQLEAQLSDHAPAVHECTGITVHTEPMSQEHALYHLPLQHPLPMNPVIVGTGPAGIMAAYLLALHGCKPIVIDRGFPVDKRAADIDQFMHNRELNSESNYLFGEGGAGTYSDGKLYTRVKDSRMRFILEAFVKARATKRILYDHHPHIGSDILPHMARRLRQQIEEWGGTFRWGSAVTDIITTGKKCSGVVLADGERIEAPFVLMAIGHSARELIRTLCKHNVNHKAKGYQIGCRIEHPQTLIDTAQYGKSWPRYLLSSAEYNLVSRPKNGAQNTTTFCMCPGGEIIPATSDRGQLSTNGMSKFARASGWANAGLIINQPVDYESTGLQEFDKIDAIEKAAFAAGGNNYTCPAQSALHFMRGEKSKKIHSGSYKLGMQPGRIDHLLPQETVEALRAALKHFERVIPGFMKKGTLVGVESRVSSPVRFERNPDTLASSLDGLYLAGEGAGYAGGITSAALDGVRIAECILTGKPVSKH